MGVRVLLVDDEGNVLDALKRQLRGVFEVVSASSGKEALGILRGDKGFAVIVADMRMPEMDGTTFLEAARKECPDAVRMMLTGNADQGTAIGAINRGAIFRFLNKPCETDDLIDAIRACFTQHDLIVAEREVLENTLSGSIRILMDVLSMVHPESFGRSQTLKARAGVIARKLRLEQVWAIELAAMFSRIGVVVVPSAVLQRARQGAELNAYESRLMSRVPALGATLLSQIPRMERIVDILRHQDAFYIPQVTGEEGPHADQIPVGSRLLRVLNDYADLEERGLEPSRAFFVLRRQAGRYDPALLAASEELLLHDEALTAGYPLAAEELKPGMRLVADVVAVDGQLLMSKGAIVSAALIERLVNFAPLMQVQEPLMIDPSTMRNAA